MARARIVLANACICGYPQGGGVWTVFLQYILGLQALGYEVLFLEVVRGTGDREQDDMLAARFFERMREYGVAEHCAVLRVAKDALVAIRSGEMLGKSDIEVQTFIEDADLLWNMCGALGNSPVLASVKRRVFVDLDPGHLQVSALSCDLGLESHDAFLTVGGKLHDPDCEVPTLGFNWRRFLPFVHLPMWTPDLSGTGEAFTSVTQWTWGELHLKERVLSTSKRDGYLRFVELPKLAKRPFELAANLHYRSPALENDRALLTSNGWSLADPHTVAGSPRAYQQYITRSRAEISCPKPIFRELRTGWVSDRSACYLASGRPVLAEDTGFSDVLPTGEGLLSFRDMDSALAGVTEITVNYARHSRRARELAVEYMSADKVLEEMIDASFYSGYAAVTDRSARQPIIGS